MRVSVQSRLRPHDNKGGCSFSPDVLEATHVNQELDLVLLEVTADLGRQQDAGAGAELPVLLVELPLEHQLLEVDEGHGHRGLLVAALVLRQLPDLPFQAAGEEEGGGVGGSESHHLNFTRTFKLFPGFTS